MATPFARSVRTPSRNTSARLLAMGTSALTRIPDPPRELAIFDIRIPNLESLLLGLRPGVEAIVLVGAVDGIYQVSSWLNTHHRFDFIHIFATGRAGRLVLGNSTLSTNTLPKYATALREWRQHLSRTGIMQIYTSHLGATPQGETFVQRLSEALDVTIATSRHPLGQGRWLLDMVHGDTPIAHPLRPDCISTYDQIL